jgi:hypothetical protein
VEASIEKHESLHAQDRLQGNHGTQVEAMFAINKKTIDRRKTKDDATVLRHRATAEESKLKIENDLTRAFEGRDHSPCMDS